MLGVVSVQEKLASVEEAVHRALTGRGEAVPEQPGRDVAVVPMRQLPPKPGLSLPEGKTRLMHDLANIELQAMELALRSLIEFPDSPLEFREQMGALVLSEAQHLRACLKSLEDIGGRWGDWPAHMALWNSVRVDDDILDRLLIVHRYLEGGGLDASAGIMRKLNGIQATAMKPAVEMILREEVDHVAFGSKWYKHFCAVEGLDPDEEFRKRLFTLFPRLPRRMERIDRPLRRLAGFTEPEMDCLSELQQTKKDPQKAKGLVSEPSLPF